jgi:hypothetical protein
MTRVSTVSALDLVAMAALVCGGQRRPSCPWTVAARWALYDGDR